jgi:hypothetical protein
MRNCPCSRSFGRWRFLPISLAHSSTNRDMAVRTRRWIARELGDASHAAPPSCAIARAIAAAGSHLGRENSGRSARMTHAPPLLSGQRALALPGARRGIPQNQNPNHAVEGPTSSASWFTTPHIECHIALLSYDHGQVTTRSKRGLYATAHRRWSVPLKKDRKHSTGEGKQ